jgi:FkbM family methyltransferase
MIVNRLDWVDVPGGGASGVGLTLLNTGSYEPIETNFLLDLFAARRQSHGDGVTVLDIGANIGTHTVLWASYMRGWGSVVAVEPQERLFYALAGNIAINNCFNARAVWAACGAWSGTIGVPRLDYQRPANMGGLSLKPGVEQRPGQPVDFEDVLPTPCISIDDMGLPRVDAIKIDVEGMEPEVFSGGMETIKRYRPIVFAEHIICGENPIHDALPGYRFLGVGINTLAMPEDDPLWDRIKTDALES